MRVCALTGCLFVALAGCGSPDTSGETASGGAGSGAGGSGAGGSQSGASGSSAGGSQSGGASGSSGAAGSNACGGIAIPMGKGGPSGGAVGVWENVTPAGIDPTYSGDNFGLQEVLVDPARPGDLYTFVSHQGVWKSTDYGLTWAKVNTGMNGSVIDDGKPWHSAIDTDRCRDPETPPTLYTFNGAGSQNGFWRSSDGGVSWSRSALPDDSGGQYPQDAYSVNVDPYDGKHVIVGFHEATGYVESGDGGQTWKVIKLDAGMAGGVSWYGFFIDTGDAAKTARTWLLIPQDNGGGVGTWRTEDGGESWARVESLEHPHGNCQIFQHDGVVYIAGTQGTKGHGVYRSSDFGVSWEHMGNTSPQGVVYGTGKYVYSQYAWACGGCDVDQSQAQRAPMPGTAWETWPLDMDNGPKGAGVTYDGANYIIVSGNWNAGIWRYVEP